MNSSKDERDPIDPIDPIDHDDADADDAREPGGPYFGRLLVVLLLAVAFCGFMTWYLGSVMTN